MGRREMKGPGRGGQVGMPVFLNTTDADFDTRFAALLSMKREDAPEVDDAVAAIIDDVRARGDAADLELTERFDRMTLTQTGSPFRTDEIDAAIAQVPEEERAALDLAAARIRAYHERQLPKDERWVDETGATLGWRWSAVSAAGLYVPGGLASYPSSVLMNAIPAQVAGVERLVICAPTPGRGGEPAGSAGRAAVGGGRGLSHRRRAGGGGHGLWHRDHRAGGQDHRPRQRLCRRGQAARLRARSAST
jgi:histidinol dehydrogenase